MTILPMEAKPTSEQVRDRCEDEPFTSAASRATAIEGEDRESK
jgi:hypothetical protein